MHYILRQIPHRHDMCFKNRSTASKQSRRWSKDNRGIKNVKSDLIPPSTIPSESLNGSGWYKAALCSNTASSQSTHPPRRIRWCCRASCEQQSTCNCQCPSPSRARRRGGCASSGPGRPRPSVRVAPTRSWSSCRCGTRTRTPGASESVYRRR